MIQYMKINDIKNTIESFTLTKKEIASQQLHQIISLLPVEIRNLIYDAFVHQRIPKE